MDHVGMTALMHASSAGHAEVVRLLLEAGAAKDLHGFGSGTTALGCAAAAGHAEIVQLLLLGSPVVPFALFLNQGFLIK